MGFETPKVEAPKKEQNNSEKYQKEALEIAQRMSRQWQKLINKVKLDNHVIGSDPQLQEIYDMNQPPKSGMQAWFEYQVDSINTMTGDENAKSRMMYRLKEDLERIEERFNDIIE